MTTTKKSCIFGWLGVLVGLFITVVFQGALGNQSGMLLEPICTDLGIGGTLFSSLLSVTTLVNLLCSLTFAKFLTTLGIKKMTIIGAFGAVLYCAFLVIAGNVENGAVPLMLIGHVCFGVCMSWSGAMTVSILINNWFAKRAGTIISIVSAFAGLSGTVFAPLVTAWIVNDGWQASVIYRAIPVVIIFVLFFFIIRVAPGPKDKRVWEDTAAVSEGEETGAAELSGMMLEEARKSRKFWFGIFTTFGIGCFIYPAAVVCLPALAGDLGFGASAGTVMSVLFASNLVVTLVLGGLVEKFGCRKALAPVFVLTAISMVILSLSGLSLSMVFAAAVLMGVGYSLVFVAVPLITMEAFGAKDFGRIQSFLFSAMVFGMVVGAPLFNAIYDFSGSYSISYIVGAVASVVLVVTLFITTAAKKNA